LTVDAACRCEWNSNHSWVYATSASSGQADGRGVGVCQSVNRACWCVLWWMKSRRTVGSFLVARKRRCQSWHRDRIVRRSNGYVDIAMTMAHRSRNVCCWTERWRWTDRVGVLSSVRARVCVCVCVCVCVSPSLSLSHSVSIFSPVAHSHINKSIRVFHRIIFLRDRFHLHDMRCRTNCNMESTIEIVVFNRRKLTNQSNMRRIIDYDWSIFYNLSLFTMCSLFSVSYFVTFCFFLIFSVLLTIVFLAIFLVSFEIR